MNEKDMTDLLVDFTLKLNQRFPGVLDRNLIFQQLTDFIEYYVRENKNQ